MKIEKVSKLANDCFIRWTKISPQWHSAPVKRTQNHLQSLNSLRAWRISEACGVKASEFFWSYPSSQNQDGKIHWKFWLLLWPYSYGSRIISRLRRWFSREPAWTQIIDGWYSFDKINWFHDRADKADHLIWDWIATIDGKKASSDSLATFAGNLGLMTEKCTQIWMWCICPSSQWVC